MNMPFEAVKKRLVLKPVKVEGIGLSMSIT